MSPGWAPRETTTHQDHVIAHIIDATVLGYFIQNEALYVLLDIGFIWTVYLDGEMALLPHPVCTAELETDEQTRLEIKRDVDLLLSLGREAEGLRHLTLPPVECALKEVAFYERDLERRFVLEGEPGSLVVETSLTTAEIKVYGKED